MNRLLRKVNQLLLNVKSTPEMTTTICVFSDIDDYLNYRQLSTNELKSHEFDIFYVQGDDEKIRADITVATNMHELIQCCDKLGYSLGVLPCASDAIGNIWSDEPIDEADSPDDE